jgi:hypothetical protein
MVSEIKLPQLASQLNNGEGVAGRWVVGPHRERDGPRLGNRPDISSR